MVNDFIPNNVREQPRIERMVSEVGPPAFDPVFKSGEEQKTQWLQVTPGLNRFRVMRGRKGCVAHGPIILARFRQVKRGKRYLPSLRAPHLASAALRALSARSSGVIFAARAFPPFTPPNFPRATAAAFFSFSGGGGVTSPMASWKTWKASSLGSRGL